jgi:hypothetical protein
VLVRAIVVVLLVGALPSEALSDIRCSAAVLETGVRQAAACFSPWCTKHSYLCTSKPDAANFQACPMSDLKQGEQSFQRPMHSGCLTFTSSRSS